MADSFCCTGETNIGEGTGTPLQCSCLEDPMGGGAWWAAVHGVTKSRTRLSDFTFTFHFSCIGEGNGNPLQCSCLENPRNGRAWWAAVCGVAQSRSRLKRLSSSSSSNWTLCPGEKAHTTRTTVQMAVNFKCVSTGRLESFSITGSCGQVISLQLLPASLPIL